MSSQQMAGEKCGLVTKKLDSNGDYTVDQTFHWLYDGNQIVLEFDGRVQ